MIFDQAEFDVRCEWGENGVRSLAPVSDAIVIVDVMSFSTCVTVAVAAGATVLPYRWKDGSARDFAQSIGAELAGSRGSGGYSLSPRSVLAIPSGTRLVLPSPNGSTLTLATGDTPTYAGCLRNARAVARAAAQNGARISVVACGERWKEDHSLRPAFEDLVGAGAIIGQLAGSRSPEARMAVAALEGAKPDLLDQLKQCSSGKELIGMGYEDDIRLGAELDADDVAPVLVEGAYEAAGSV